MTDLIPLEEIERLRKRIEDFKQASDHKTLGDMPPEAFQLAAELQDATLDALPSLLAAAECAHRQRAEIERLREIVNSLPKTADSEPIYFGRRLYVIDDGDDEDEYQEPYDPVEGWFVVQGIEPSCGANGEDLITVCDENDCFEVWSSLCYAKNPIGEPTP